MVSDTLIKQVQELEEPETGETKIFGFWVYLMSDCIIFASLFATYVVLVNGTAGGSSGKDIFNLPFVLTETFLLLLSSITYGIAMLQTSKNKQNGVNRWLFLTFLLGLSFIGMEFYEFYHLMSAGFGPQRSAFLSGFFTLIGTHGLHVIIGLVWMLVLMIQVATKGLTAANQTRLMCLSLFWHFLDVVWICVFTVVYLMGVIT